jgi:hypothetical protein
MLGDFPSKNMLLQQYQAFLGSLRQFSDHAPVKAIKQSALSLSGNLVKAAWRSVKKNDLLIFLELSIEVCDENSKKDTCKVKPVRVSYRVKFPIRFVSLIVSFEPTRVLQCDLKRVAYSVPLARNGVLLSLLAHGVPISKPDGDPAWQQFPRLKVKLNGLKTFNEALFIVDSSTIAVQSADKAP